MQWYLWVVLVLVLIIAAWWLWRSRRDSARRDLAERTASARRAASYSSSNLSRPLTSTPVRDVAAVPAADRPTTVPDRPSLSEATVADVQAAAPAVIPPGAYGEGSAAPAADGSGPAGWTVKGNTDSMLYHTTESPYYGRTKAEAWFQTEDHARAAGFARWDSRR